MAHTLCFDIATSRWHTDRKTGEMPCTLRIAWWDERRIEPECLLIRPNSSFAIDPGTFPYHGLTVEHLLENGVDSAAAVKEFERAADGASAIVSFHADFHWRALYRLMGLPDTTPRPPTMVCAMALATPILAIPAMRPGGGLKSPNLREACAFFDVPPPRPVKDGPMALALSTVRAVSGVYEACLRRVE